mgnify:CR=1 FL=1
MKTVYVRVWELFLPNPADGQNDKVMITYPEDNGGYDLISCLKCGQVYAASVAKQVYIGPPLEEKLRGLRCKICGSDLARTAAKYPERYLSHTGVVLQYERPQLIPDASESKIMEILDVYS